MLPTTSSNMLQAIGNTPLVKLSKIVPDDCADIYVKLEYYNPTGSYKDRMALAIIEGAEQRGILKKGMSVVEYTGGSTGTSLAFVCAVKGYHFKAVSSDAFAKEKLQTIQLFGAEIDIIPSTASSITPDLFVRMEGRVKEIESHGNYYCTKQFINEDALVGHYKLGQEIIEQLHRPITIFCASVGTGGMLVGAGTALKKANSATKLIVLEPASSAVITTGVKGSHRIEGTAAGIIPPILKHGTYDEAVAFEESDARVTARLLASQEGIFAGTSTGLNVFAAITFGKQLGKGHTVVTVACDSGMKYLSGDLFC